MLLLHLLLTSFLSFSFAQTVDELYYDIFTHINDTLNKNIPYIYNNDNFTSCYNRIESLFNSSESDKIEKMFSYSGRSSSDLGLYYQCDSENFTYYLLVYNISIPPFNQVKTEQEQLSYFLNQSDQLYGICIVEECSALISSDIIKDITNQFIQTDGDINYYKYSGGHNQSDDSSEIFGIIFLVILFGILLLKIVVWSWNSCCKEQKTVIKTQMDIPSATLDDSSSISYYEPSMMKEKDLPLFPYRFSSISYDNDNTITIKERLINLFHEVFDLGNSLLSLLDKKNKYYDSTNIELISFFRFIVMICMIYNHNYYSLMKIPMKNSNDISYYKSAKMILYKITTFGVSGWIGLDGFVASFKLFSYLKKNIHNDSEENALKDINKKEKDIENVKIKYFLKFYLYSITKIFSMIIIFIVLSLRIRDFNKLMKFPPMFNYFENNLNYRECKQNYQFFKILIPFYFSYIDYWDDYPRGYTFSYKYVYICVNTHLSFIFFLLVVYLSFKLKSKIFDVIITLAFFANTICIYFTIEKFYPTYLNSFHFDINYLFGENFSLKYTHLFINLYFVGIFIGIIYFYYIDIISAKPLDSYTKFIPFEFCYKLVKIIDQSGKVFRAFIVILCSAIIIFLSCGFLIRIKIEEKLLFEMKTYYQYFDMYEKIIFQFAFMTIILILLFMKGNSAFKSLTQKSIFSLFDRISFGILCSMDNAIYLFYTTYYIVLVLDFNNLMMIAFGLIFIIGLFNFAYYILVEQPIRIVVKTVLRTKSIRDNKQKGL